MLLLLPLVLRTFSPDEVAVWLLFSTVASMQLIGDVGFSQTFARTISQVRGGAVVSQLGRIVVVESNTVKKTVDTNELLRLLSTIRPVYRTLAFITFGLLLLLTLVMRNPVSQVGSQSHVWLAWIVVIIGTTVAVYGNTYVGYLMGVERIAPLRRWEALFGILSIGSAALSILMGGGLFAIVVIQQTWVVITVLRNRWLSHKDPLFVASANMPKDNSALRVIWPAAWKSGLGVFMSFGLIQASALICANLTSGTELAIYLLGLRIIQMISQLSQAPFYSKIPTLSRLFAEGKVIEMITLAKKGMLLANLTFISGFIFIAQFGDFVLKMIHSKTALPDITTWGIFGIAFFAERSGAMHLQLYSTTNHIIWHITNGLTGIVMIFFSYIFFENFGIIGFPIAMALSYILIYCSISLKYSSNEFKLTILNFHTGVTILPTFLATVMYAVIYIC